MRSRGLCPGNAGVLREGISDMAFLLGEDAPNMMPMFRGAYIENRSF